VGRENYTFGPVALDKKWGVCGSARVLPKLEVIEDMPTPLDFVGVFLLSTIVFGFSRFLCMLIALCEGKWFYDLEKEKLSSGRKEHIEMVIKSSWKGHFIGIIIYLLFFAFGWLCITV